MKGNVKWYNLKKRFGYIIGEDGQEYFMHGQSIKSGRHYVGFEDEDEVEFEITEGKKGPIAANVVMTNKPGAAKPSES